MTGLFEVVVQVCGSDEVPAAPFGWCLGKIVGDEHGHLNIALGLLVLAQRTDIRDGCGWRLCRPASGARCLASAWLW